MAQLWIHTTTSATNNQTQGGRDGTAVNSYHFINNQTRGSQQWIRIHWIIYLTRKFTFIRSVAIKNYKQINGKQKVNQENENSLIENYANIIVIIMVL